MIDRRHMLSLAGAGLLNLTLSACRSAARRTTPAMQAAALCKPLPTPVMARVSHDGLLRLFHELDCRTASAMTQPHGGPGFQRHIEPRFRRLFRLLAEMPYERRTAEAWRRFYGLTARMHEVRNRRAQAALIPVYAYNGHHHAARLWLDEVARRGTRGPLLHFDSHHDMRALADPATIVAAVDQLRDNRAAALQRLRRLVHDPATPVSAGVLGGAITKIVWAAPHWSKVQQFIKRNLVYADIVNDGRREYQMIYDGRGGGPPLLPAPGHHSPPWLDYTSLSAAQRASMRRKRRVELSFLQTYRRTPHTLGVLKEAIPAGRFILDIDLDYIMTVDADAGFKRPSSAEQVADNGNFGYDNQLARARERIDERLNELTQLLVDLRAARRIPSMVTIADSTYRPFDVVDAGVGFWEYMPYEFAAYVHWRVRELLAVVYAKDGIAAGVDNRRR